MNGFFLLFGNAINFKDEEVFREIVCLSCKKTVTAKLFQYGNGYIATCPCCRKLAYNGE